MFLIADSGSTKTDWRLISEDKKTHHFQTCGFNPYFHSSQFISQAIRSELLPQLTTHNSQLTIFFYGAGCSGEEKAAIVFNGLQACFPNAKFEVHHDLLGAARALCGREEGIAAILGTGSNSCYYDGKDIADNVPSLGYILGDEGSGAHIGKTFINHLLYKELPAELEKDFYTEYSLNKQKILNTVYPMDDAHKTKDASPSRYLASFSPFWLKHIRHPFMAEMLYNCFSEFFVHHIFRYAKHKKIKMHCTGSIGFYFQDILRKVAADKGVTLHKIIKNPIEELVAYHLKG